jgi:glycosyltransferase involved in cell wall biosynthesis
LKGVSVILCCYNSSHRLPQTLKYLARQEVPENIQWELLIVNNNSTDGTSDIAMVEWKKYGVNIPFRIVDEPLQGLSYARAKGGAEAVFDYILFCDDDNWLDKDYVRIAFDTMESHLDAGIAGGQSIAYFESDAPLWFPLFSQSYAVEQPFPSSRYLPPERIYLAGAGMIISRKILVMLLKVQFNPLLRGRSGSDLMSGEDVELCLLSRFLGFNIYYNEDLLFIHFIPAKRLTWDYCLKMTTVGLAVPLVWFDMYQAIFLSYTKRKRLKFSAFCSKQVITYFAELVFDSHISFIEFINFFGKLKFLFRNYPGSVGQVHMLSSIKKLLFMLKNRKLLSSDFKKIWALVIRINSESNMNKIHAKNG